MLSNAHLLSKAHRLGQLLNAFVLATTLVCPCLCFGQASRVVSADPNAQRRLDPPTEAATNNVLMQYQMMQKLRQLVGGNNASQDSAQPSWLSDMLQDINLDKLLNNLSPEDLQALANQLPPEELGAAAKDPVQLQSELLKQLNRPEVQQNPQFQELLNRYLRDKQSPSKAGDPETGASDMGTSGAGNTRGLPDISPRDSAPPTNLQNTRSRQTAPPLNSNNPPSPSSSQRQLAPPAQQQPSPSAGDVPGSQTSPRPSGEPPAGAQAGSPRARPRSGNSGLPAVSNARDLDSLLRSLPPSLRSQLPEMNSSGSQTDSSGMTAGAPAGVQEFLKQMQQDPSSLPKLENLLTDLPRANGQSNSQLSDQLKSMVPDQLRQKMEGKGFSKTLRGLVSEANRQVRSGKAETSDSTSTAPSSLLAGVEKSVLKALDGVSQDLIKSTKKDTADQVSSSKQASRGKRAGGPSLAFNPKSLTSTGSEQSSSRSSGKSSSSDSKSEKPTGFFSAAAKFVNGLATNGDSETASTPSAGPAAATSILGSDSSSQRGYLSWVVLPLLGMLLLAWLFFWRKPASQLERRIRAIPVGEIRSGADVISAFHAIAGGNARQAELWWTHQRAAVELSATEPESRSAWTTLAELYERARYCSQLAPLSESQLADARQAIQRLQAS